MSILWGEKDDGTKKPHVERHVQMEVGAEVHPWPIHEASRKPPRLFIGAAENPCADPTEWRPDRLAKKVEAGADFIVS